ncbi:MAG: PEP/pyruvate-binding domain-containing protein [Bacteroidetes bacterium]|nr:PEP/pyruvate-binding domain-containing protein [Bacteroidota bacterium]
MSKQTAHTRILWLGDEACDNPAISGGKAASLSRLAARFPVPAGFCLPADLLEVLADAGLAIDTAAELLGEAYLELAKRAGCDDPRVAVRSSAADEDGLGLSFAGQYETLLNIGAGQLVQAVERCIASGQSERVGAYRQQHGRTDLPVRMAVLVQHLVPADVAAVAFSANPVSGARDEVVINASWGIGESIVGGTVTPDTWIIRKADGMVMSTMIAEKQRMTVLTDHGTMEVDVPRIMRTQPALTEEQAAAIADLAIQLEEESGHAVDVECAFADNALALLQCRPITTLA